MAFIFDNPLNVDGSYDFANPGSEFIVGPPQFVGDVSGSLSLLTQITVNFNIDQACTVYYIVVQEGSSVPTPGQVKSGNNYTGGTVLKVGNKAVSSGAGSYVITGLGAYEGDTLTIYTTAENANGIQRQNEMDSLTLKLDYVLTAGFSSNFD